MGKFLFNPWKILLVCLFILTTVRSQLEIPDEGILFEEPHVENIEEKNKEVPQVEEGYIPHHPGREPSYRPSSDKREKNINKIDKIKDLQDIQDIGNYDNMDDLDEMRGMPQNRRKSTYDRNGAQEDFDMLNEDIVTRPPHDGMGNNRAGLNHGMPGGRRNVGGGMGNMHSSNNMHDSMNSYNSNNNQQIYSNGNNGSQFKPSGWFGSLYEILMLVFLVGFIFNCFCGKTYNDKYALAWYSANKQYFEERYEMIGLGKSDNPDELDFKMPNDSPVIKENPFVYKFYCAKYRYVKWLLAVLEFRKRTDAVYLLSSLFTSNKDRIIYEVAINPVEEVGWMFCVCKKKDAKVLRSSYPDIDFLAKNFDPSIFSEKLTVLSENIELFIELFQNKNLLSFYKSIEHCVDLIYYTDQQSFCRDKFALFFSFEIHLNTAGGNERLLLEITHFVNLFSDTLAQMKFSEKAKKEFEKNRVMYERAKMEEAIRREVEDKEKKDFIEDWKMKSKMKGKKMNKKKKPTDVKNK